LEWTSGVLNEEDGMNVQLRDVAKTADPTAYRILLEVGVHPYVFVLRVEHEPIANVRAPHSFWLLCESIRIDAGLLLKIVERFDAGEEVELPVSIDGAGENSEQGGHRLWMSQSAAYLSKESLRRAASYFATHADTSLFPRPFEYTLIAQAWDELEPFAQKINLLEHRLRSKREYFAPKSSVGTRVATQLDPLDTLLLTASVFELGAKAEKARIPVSEGVVHSFRFCGTDNKLWDDSVGWPSFTQRTRELLDDLGAGYVVETDISSFYHRIPVDVAAHALERAGGDRRLIEGVRRILNTFTAMGLPVGPTPSAFFAEAVLNEVDASLLAAKAQFVRFNDDFRFFCKTEAEARLNLELLASLLWRTAGLTLQESKTEIIQLDKYRRRLEANSEDEWLTELKKEIIELDPYANPEPEELNDEEKQLVKNARDRLLQAIATQHLAWIKTSQKALAALPLRERVQILPFLLKQLTRLKSIARDISASVSICGLKLPDERSELLEIVVRSLHDNEDFLADSDYTRTWLMRGFSRTDWPDAVKLLSVAERWPKDFTAKREIIWALRDEPQLLGAMEVDPTDRWLRRVLIATHVHRPAYTLVTTSSNEQKWDLALEALIAHSHAVDDGTGQE
jgi:hypothetical protein